MTPSYRTKTGRTLNEGEVDALAEEVEATSTSAVIREAIRAYLEVA